MQMGHRQSKSNESMPGAGVNVVVGLCQPTSLNRVILKEGTGLRETTKKFTGNRVGES